MVLIVGQVARGHLGREAFQEVDFEAMFAPLAKWACEVTEQERIPELVSRAYHVACSGRPGPVVLSFPEDVLAEPAEVADAEPYRVVQAHPGRDELEHMTELLAAAERPLLLVGGGGWTAEAARDMLAFAEAGGLPTVASFRCQSYVDNHSPMYAGWAGVGIDPGTGGEDPRGRPAPRRRRQAGRGDDRRATRSSSRRARASASSTCMRIRTSSAASTRVICSSTPARRSSRRPPPRSTRWTALAGRAGASCCGPSTSRSSTPREVPGELDLGRGRGAPARAAAGRRHPGERRRQLHGLAAALLPVPALPHPARADERRHGLRRAGRRRRQDRAARARPSSASRATATS